MNKMNKLLAVAAGAEAATGLFLMIAPPLVTRLLLGAEVSDVAIAVARLAGIGLFSFGLACWPDRSATKNLVRAFRAMLTYSFLCTLYLLYLGFGGEWVGVLLWPAALYHGVVTFLLARAWFNVRKAVE